MAIRHQLFVLSKLYHGLIFPLSCVPFDVLKDSGFQYEESTINPAFAGLRFFREFRNPVSCENKMAIAPIHWLSIAHALPAEVRLYDLLFADENPDVSGELADAIDPKSLEVLPGCWVEPSLADAQPGARYQFERTGYFSVDPDSTRDSLVFNRTVSLRDSWAKIERQGGS